jgi:ABC-type multidrug transport system fused ATPase/permease subunit
MMSPMTRGPVRYLLWILGRQKRRVALGAFYGTTWMVGLAIEPYLIAMAIDRGLRPRLAGPLLAWTAAVLALSIANALVSVLRHRTMTKLRLDAGMRTADAVLDHAVRLGSALPRGVTAGEVVTIGISDVWTIARAMSVTGPGVGAVVAYGVVAVLLFRISPTIALVELAGVPILAVVLGPLLGRLQTTGDRYRERQGALAGRLLDILGGLRILNGLGGKDMHAVRYRAASGRLRGDGYRVGAANSWIQALGTGVPTVFLAVITWLAARLAARHEVTIGELVAIYGYVAVLVLPVSFVIIDGAEAVRGVVAARRVIGFLRLPVAADAGDDPPPGPAELHDPVSGVTVRPGRLTALAAAEGADAAAVIDRLGGYGDTTATWGGVAVDRVARPALRDRVLVADHEADLFAGALRDVIAGRADPDDDALRRAVHAAAAHDLGPRVAADGRNLSGGQCQRVRLARAVYADPEMLLTAEPTSAVDAHTEAAIADRLTAARRGRGTLVATTSPALLDRADVVHYLVGGRVAASGAHRDLLARDPGYRRLVGDR